MSDGGRPLSLLELSAFRRTELTDADRIARFWRHHARAQREIARPDPRHVLLDQIAAEPEGPASYDGHIFPE